MTIKTTKLAGLVVAALTLAAPLAIASPADAAPMRGEMMMTEHHSPTMQIDAYRDRDHRPPLRIEYRPHTPRGHYRWHSGAWSWSHGHWAWVPGVYVRF